MLRTLCLILALSTPTLATALAQDAPAVPAADPADVATIDGVIEALYASISGPAGPRDWDRLRTLFAPGAVLAPSVTRADGTAPLRVIDVEQYVRGAGAYFMDNPFYEVEYARELHRFGNVANAMSAYESRRAPEEEPFTRGINTITLIHDGERWWVLSIAWDEQREGNEIPADFGD